MAKPFKWTYKGSHCVTETLLYLCRSILGLDIFPSIKRRSGNISVVGTMDDSTTKEILHTLNRAAKKPSELFGGSFPRKRRATS